MTPAFNRNIHSLPLMKWMQALRFLPQFKAARARPANNEGITSDTFSAADASRHSTDVALQRSYFSGNFFAGPAALIHPDLLKPEIRKQKRK